MISVRDTIAWKIISQFTDHLYGSDAHLTDDKFLSIYNSFLENGGSWKSLIDGDVDGFTILEDILECQISE